jgi:HSP20 family molecular chaperone IbpA
MSEKTDIAVEEKQEVDTAVHQELRSGNWFVPSTDVYEAPDKIVLVMDMPGVCFDCAHVDIVDDELIVTGHVTTVRIRMIMCCTGNTPSDIIIAISVCQK